MSLDDQIGSFCWWSLMTKDIAVSNIFYQNLFNWILDNVEITGQGKTTIYTAENGGFGSPIPLPPTFPGPSYWMAYITVADVDKACAQAKALGGDVCAPPFDLPNTGRTAVITDPIGSAFHIFTPTQPRASLHRLSNAPGAICWMELMADDPTPLLPFYRELLGWTFADPLPMNGGAYISFAANGTNMGGIMKRPPQVLPMPPVWLHYFSVPSVDECSEKVKALGGKIIVPKMDIPGTGFFACMEDPMGAVSYLFEWLKS